MEFLLFLLFVSLNLVFLGGVSYYSRILFFQRKQEYNREEITSIGRAIPIEILRILESGGNMGIGLGVLFIAVFISELWARLGGLIGSPHYTHSVGNYFFHFPLFFVVFTIGYSFLRDAFGGLSQKEPSKTFWDHGQVFAIGLGLGSLSKTLSSYGAHHEMYFVFCLLQILIVGSLSAWLWNGQRLFGLSLPGETQNSEEYEYTNNDSNEEDWNESKSSDSSTEFNSDWDDLGELES
jgi:hypothetical protein